MAHACGRFSGTATMAAAAGCLLTACGAGTGSTALEATGSLLRVGVGQVSSSPGQGLRPMAQIWTVESLATLTDEGRPRPSIAKDWSVSPDGLSLTVNLASN